MCRHTQQQEKAWATELGTEVVVKEPHCVRTVIRPAPPPATRQGLSGPWGFLSNGSVSSFTGGFGYCTVQQYDPQWALRMHRIGYASGDGVRVGKRH